MPRKHQCLYEAREVDADGRWKQLRIYKVMQRNDTLDHRHG